MDMTTPADLTRAKNLVAALSLPLRAFPRCFAEVVKTAQGPKGMLHSPFTGSKTFTTMDEALTLAAESEAARKAGVLPRELRRDKSNDACPAYLLGLPLVKLPARFAHVVPKDSPLRP